MTANILHSVLSGKDLAETRAKEISHLQDKQHSAHGPAVPTSRKRSNTGFAPPHPAPTAEGRNRSGSKYFAFDAGAIAQSTARDGLEHGGSGGE